MANKKTYEYWEKELKDYNKQILSIFIEKNELTTELKNIKNKKDKIIADFGCGIGNSFKFLKDFKKVYAIDYSQNMLNFAEKQKTGNEILINEEISKVKLPQKTEVSIAISSIVPDNLNEFYEIIDNIVLNTKKNGTIIMNFSSFESRIFSFQLEADYMFKQNVNPSEIFSKIKQMEINENFNTLGYMESSVGLVQKQWLKEELLFRLEKYNLKNLEIKKLNLNWETQIKKKEFENYPNLWMWLVIIQI